MAEPRPHDELESPRAVGWPFALTAVGVLAFLALSIGVLWAVYDAAVPDRRQPPVRMPPPPRLLAADPPAERRAVEAAQRARLAGYRWVDRDHKVVSIPIERAMAIIAARGTDAFAPIPGAPQAQAAAVPTVDAGGRP